MRVLLALGLIVAAGCSGQRPQLTTNKLVLLTRAGCANSETMRQHLDEALKAIGADQAYRVIDIANLPKTDVRRGYPTPTVLYNNRDLFGMPEPEPPVPDPT